MHRRYGESGNSDADDHSDGVVSGADQTVIAAYVAILDLTPTA